MKQPTIFMVLFVLSRHIQHSLQSPVPEAMRSDLHVGTMRSSNAVAEAAGSLSLSGAKPHPSPRHRRSDSDAINEAQNLGLQAPGDVDEDSKRSWDDESVISWIKRKVHTGERQVSPQDLYADNDVIDEYDPMTMARSDLRASETISGDELKRKWDEGDMAWIKRAASRRPAGKLNAQYAASGHRGKRLAN